MTARPNLLTLPPEIRDQIWTLAFGGLHVTPFETAYDLSSECVACLSLAEKRTDTIIPHTTAIAPLRTCKQIYHEARLIMYQTLAVHISSSDDMSKIGMTGNRSPTLHEHIQQLTLYIHLDSESRTHWVPELSALSLTFPGLQKLCIHCHMRPPRDYDSLVDATYLLGPLILLPPRIRPSAERARLDLSGSRTTDSESSGAQQHVQNHQHQQEEEEASTHTAADVDTDPASQQPPLYAPRDLNPNFSIHFNYNVSEVLFDSPFIGTISTTDALDEHDAVLRDCLVNTEFRHLAEQRDLQSMTMVLFSIARDHEQGWLEGLYRRRLRDYALQTEILGEDVDLEGAPESPDVGYYNSYEDDGADATPW